MKRTLNTLIILIVIDLVGVAGLWWGYTTMQNKKSEETVLRTQLMDEEQKGKTLLALRRTLAAVQKDDTELTQFLYDPSDEGQIQFVSQIEQLGTSTTGALVETASLDLTKETPPSLRGEFSVKGTWGQVFHFLRLLETFPSHLVINRFDVHSVSTNHWEGRTQVVLMSLKANNSL